MQTTAPAYRPRFQCTWLPVLLPVVLALPAPAATVTPLAVSAAPPAFPATRPARDDDHNPYLWRPRTTSVAVFKNGLGFIVREGEVELRDGWCIGKEIPPTAFGTLAIYSLNPNEVVDIVGSGPGEVIEFDGRDAPDTPEARRARLEASKNLKVNLTYDHKGSERSAAGALRSVGPDFVVLEAENSNLAVPVDGIRRLQVLELPLRIHISSLDGKTPTKTKLGMAYLRKGLTWIPEYTLDMKDKENATLTLRGTLINEAEDLIGCDINFVVGVPHFVHTEYLAPVAVGQTIRTIGAAIAPNQVMSQVMNRAAITSNGLQADQFTPGVAVIEQPITSDSGNLQNLMGSLPQLSGPASADYTVYKKAGLTLRRGERAIVTLFAQKIRYGHLYRWNTTTAMQHFLQLRNDTASAWTTGPCLAMNDFQPLSEDLLKYTPRGGRAELPVTTSVNIAHDKSEREADRKLKDYQPAPDHFFDLVTLEGELKLRNFESEPVDLQIENPVPGKPVSASHEGKTLVDTSNLKLTERSGSVRWTLRLAPGEERTLTYRYERYVPSK